MPQRVLETGKLRVPGVAKACGPQPKLLSRPQYGVVWHVPVQELERVELRRVQPLAILRRVGVLKEISIPKGL